MVKPEYRNKTDFKIAKFIIILLSIKSIYHLLLVLLLWELRAWLPSSLSESQESTSIINSTSSSAFSPGGSGEGDLGDWSSLMTGKFSFGCIDCTAASVSLSELLSAGALFASEVSTDCPS